VIVAPAAHALVVMLIVMLTVSHGVLFNDSSNSRRLSHADLFPASPAFMPDTKNPSASPNWHEAYFSRAPTGDEARLSLNILSGRGPAAA